MNKSQKLVFELLLVCTGKRHSLENSYSEEQWLEALDIASEQAISGVLLMALDKLPKEQLPPQMVLLQWIGTAEMVEANTRQLTDASKKVVEFFKDNGFACQIL